MSAAGLGEYWNAAYIQGDATRSWFQSQPHMTLRMLDTAGISDGHSVIDVGGGASTLVDTLLERGYRDLTVLDISDTGLAAAQRRLGAAAHDVHWLVTDLLTWRPQRTYQVWHDRAVFHFLTSPEAQDHYRQALTAATAPNAAAILGTFAPDGPTRCSGLPVSCYSPERLADVLGPTWQLTVHDREEHTTPSGAVQPFTWAVFRKMG
jgi:hypothetical protein